MPFGFDPMEAEKIVKEIHEGIERTYIEVTVDWLADGRMQPIRFIWNDGREIEVDKVLAVRKGHSLKVFANGMQYYCQTGKRRYYLNYDGELWYVETKTAPRSFS